MAGSWMQSPAKEVGSAGSRDAATASENGTLYCPSITSAGRCSPWWDATFSDAATSIVAMSPAAKPCSAISARKSSIGACAVTWQA